MHDFPPFPGFRPEALHFLRTLKENNRREWFKPRKETYDDEVQWPLRCLVVDAGRRAAQAQIPLVGDPKAGLFRLYRDTRFSKNKRPYKTHAGAVLSPTGARNEEGVVYIHIEPERSFLGAGFLRPDNALLRKWRMRMTQDPATFLELVQSLDKAGLPLQNDGNALKRMPRGFEDFAESELATYLRWKSFLVSRPVTDEELLVPDFTDTVMHVTETVLPLLSYGWSLAPSR